jgi:hypothetical protein
MYEDIFGETMSKEVLDGIDDISELVGNKKCLYDFFTDSEQKILPDI